MNKRFVVILIVVIAAFLGLIVFTKKEAKAPDATASVPSNHVQGEGTSGVTMIEYGDLQCPACGAYYPIVKQVQAKYGNQITFQYRNFPLVSLHKNAMSAHRAAEAASKQGKFWEMHDMMYERQTSWAASTSVGSIFESYAKELGLNLDQYKTDLASQEVQNVINADMKEGQALNITATPGFVIDGKKLEENPRDVAGFSALIDAAIAAKKQ